MQSQRGLHFGYRRGIHYYIRNGVFYFYLGKGIHSFLTKNSRFLAKNVERLPMIIR